MARKTLMVGSLVAAIAAGCAGSAQVRSDRPYEANVVEARGGRIPVGTTLWVELDEDLSLKSRPGEVFFATVTSPVVSHRGETLIPQGARVRGHVVDVRSGLDAKGQAVIVLRLDELNMNGLVQKIDASIVETEVETGRRMPEWQKVAIGAGLGAVLGGLVEGKEGLVAGGLLGAAAGTAISLGTGGAVGELDEGTKLAVRLERPVRSLASLEGRRRTY